MAVGACMKLAGGAGAALALVAGPVVASTLIEDRADAIGYLDRAFAENGCRFTQSGLGARMVADGVAPGVDDMAQPLIGTNKIIRQRIVMSTLQSLFEGGKVCEDPTDPTVAISKFGGCA